MTTIRPPERIARHHHLEWWVVTAWGSIALVVGAGIAAAAGVG
jgi:hypothetical protein